MLPATRPNVTTPADRLRVTVLAGSRRVDLVVPGALPLAELVPEIARSVGLLDPVTAHGGYQVETLQGRGLDDGAGLAGQGVGDGSVLVMTAGVDDPPPRVYDDAVEAMADAVEMRLTGWEPGPGRRLALGASGILMIGGALALILQRDDTWTAGVAAAMSVALSGGAVVLSRIRLDDEIAVVMAWASVGYAATWGLLWAPGGHAANGPALVYVGLAVLATALVCVVGLEQRKALLVPALLVGSILFGTGILTQSVGLPPGQVLVVVTSLLLILGDAFPRFALAMTSASAEAQGSPRQTASAVAVDCPRVAADVRLAHEILLAISWTSGAVFVLAAPLAVGLGVGGLGFVVAGAAVMLLRTRRHRIRSAVMAGTAQGALGLGAAVVTVLVQQPRWHGPLSVGLIGAGVLLLVAALMPSGPSVRRERLADVAESVSLVALLPLAIVALGLI